MNQILDFVRKEPVMTLTAVLGLLENLGKQAGSQLNLGPIKTIVTVLGGLAVRQAVTPTGNILSGIGGVLSDTGKRISATGTKAAN